MVGRKGSDARTTDLTRDAARRRVRPGTVPLLSTREVGVLNTVASMQIAIGSGKSEPVVLHQSADSGGRKVPIIRAISTSNNVANRFPKKFGAAAQALHRV